MKRLPTTAEVGTLGIPPVVMHACEKIPSLREVLSNPRSIRSKAAGPSSRFWSFRHLQDQPSGRRPSRVLMQFSFVTSVDPMSRSAVEEQCRAAWPISVLAGSMVAGPYPRSGNYA